MGQWMAWNAHNILQGNFLFPDYHANFFYPHSYTLAFSEMLWPESFLYALFYACTDNLFFSFNATMLFFWALSGVLLFVLLRSLNISFWVSALGGLIYCLMPYRMPYYVEFNMVLVFIFPADDPPAHSLAEGAFHCQHPVVLRRLSDFRHVLYLLHHHGHYRHGLYLDCLPGRAPAAVAQPTILSFGWPAASLSSSPSRPSTFILMPC